MSQLILQMVFVFYYERPAFFALLFILCIMAVELINVLLPKTGFCVGICGHLLGITGSPVTTHYVVINKGFLDLGVSHKQKSNT